MALNRWRRITTGVAAGAVVLLAALIGASMRSDNAAVSVAAETRPATVIPIPEDDALPEDDADDDSVRVIDEEAIDAVDDDSADAATEGDAATADAASDAEASAANGSEETVTAPDDSDDTSTAEADEAGEGDDDAVRVIEEDDIAEAEDPATEDPATEDPATEDAAAEDPATEESAAPAPAEPAAPAAPLTTNGEQLGTGGGVDDAECALDRLVIYAGARLGGVAGSLRAAMQQSGFGAGCASPVTILASNCPLQFSGVLRAGADYDPNQSFVASSTNINRETLTAVLGEVGYQGSTIGILDFGYVRADQPGEKWIAVFIPPSFSGWEQLSNAAGLPATSQSLCGPSGRLVG